MRVIRRIVAADPHFAAGQAQQGIAIDRSSGIFLPFYDLGKRKLAAHLRNHAAVRQVQNVQTRNAL